MLALLEDGNELPTVPLVAKIRCCFVLVLSLFGFTQTLERKLLLQDPYSLPCF